ncbi:unnamed protein product [Vitrella brassicaformis CCMP3155]|uniref:C2H2-type domain-containing protein n=1 Tax=Vitrella brassicaformis (strain CCMP3155) TaxID=1169540 RepID=A0A0G4E8W2_VITBC|nr:unnamed protein product [Vitrella brassicaformis CCMP3155]|eukprot:CEL92345.1 unnamed protein product [Vitrella brassicaformis CCMP3155]
MARVMMRQAASLATRGNGTATTGVSGQTTDTPRSLSLRHEAPSNDPQQHEQPSGRAASEGGGTVFAPTFAGLADPRIQIPALAPSQFQLLKLIRLQKKVRQVIRRETRMFGQHWKHGFIDIDVERYAADGGQEEEGGGAAEGGASDEHLATQSSCSPHMAPHDALTDVPEKSVVPSPVPVDDVHHQTEATEPPPQDPPSSSAAQEPSSSSAAIDESEVPSMLDVERARTVEKACDLDPDPELAAELKNINVLYYRNEGLRGTTAYPPRDHQGANRGGRRGRGGRGNTGGDDRFAMRAEGGQNRPSYPAPSPPLPPGVPPPPPSNGGGAGWPIDPAIQSYQKRLPMGQGGIPPPPPPPPPSDSAASSPPSVPFLLPAQIQSLSQLLAAQPTLTASFPPAQQEMALSGGTQGGAASQLPQLPMGQSLSSMVSFASTGLSDAGVDMYASGSAAPQSSVYGGGQMDTPVSRQMMRGGRRGMHEGNRGQRSRGWEKDGFSFGTTFHSAGTCNPCKYEWTKGCHLGIHCRFCHHESHAPAGAVRIKPDEETLKSSTVRPEIILKMSNKKKDDAGSTSGTLQSVPSPSPFTTTTTQPSPSPFSQPASPPFNLDFSSPRSSAAPAYDVSDPQQLSGWATPMSHSSPQLSAASGTQYDGTTAMMRLMGFVAPPSAPQPPPPYHIHGTSGHDAVQNSLLQLQLQLQQLQGGAAGSDTNSQGSSPPRPPPPPPPPSE